MAELQRRNHPVFSASSDSNHPRLFSPLFLKRKMASKMLMLLAVLVALLVVSEARPGGKKGIPGGLLGGFPGGLPTRTINMPIMPAGTFGPMPPSPGAGFPLDDEPDSLESLASDPFGSVGKLLGGGGGGGGGMKKLLIIG